MLASEGGWPIMPGWSRVLSLRYNLFSCVLGSKASRPPRAYSLRRNSHASRKNLHRAWDRRVNSLLPSEMP
jgi:hypothetical protein